MSIINGHIVSKFDRRIGTGTINQPEYPCYFFYDYGYFAFIYLRSELGIGGKINITGNTIGTTDNSPITVTTGMNFNGGVSGSPVAFAYFLTSKT